MLFFFMKYLIYCIIGVFCLGAINVSHTLLRPFIASFCPWSARTIADVPQVGAVASADILSTSVGVVLALAFLITRNGSPYGWIFQDLIAAGFLMLMQRTFRLNKLKVATLLLCLFFCFDIFFVFLTPYFFHGKSVMVTVATGGGTGETIPMLIRLPAFNDELRLHDRMLGLGDIALPGLCVSFLKRYDLVTHKHWRHGYFIWGLFGYGVGLAACFVLLYLMQTGQPALMTLVPGVLTPTFILAIRRKELARMWDPEAYDGLNPMGSQSQAGVELNSQVCGDRDPIL